MTDLAAIKARLNDPREVAAMLGLRVITRQARGVITACPVHGNRSGSLSIRIGRDGTLQAVCRGCNFGPGGKGGDVLTLLGAIEGDFKRGLARAQELAGGAVGAPVAAWEAPEQLDPDVYHELATRILSAGRLDGRPWTRDVGEYLWSRRLLEQARGDEWCALPSLNWLLQIAKGLCDENAAEDDKRVSIRDGGVLVSEGENGQPDGRRVLYALFRGTPAALLVAAKLAQWNRHGELVPYFGRWGLVIPWRGPDGRICALQRRRVTDGDGPKYVLPWAPEWPYGSERLGENDRLSSIDSELVRNGPREKVALLGEHGANKPQNTSHEASGGRHRESQRGACRASFYVPNKNKPIAIVEGAIDTLALRSLYPRMLVVGIPGIGGWRTSWAKLFEGRTVRYALDRGKLNARGIIEEDRAAARIALDIAGRHEEDPNAEACSLCGGAELWLCGFCGRRRSTAKDWAEQWEGC